MTVIYADIVFLINTLVDYLMILVTGRLGGVPLQRKRYLAAALAGGLYAVISLIPTLEGLASAPVKLLIWVLMVLFSYGYSQQFLKLMLLFGSVSCTLAGVVLGIGLFFHRYLDAVFLPKGCRVLILFGLCAGFLCSVLFRTCVHPRVEGTLIPVEISMGGKRLNLTALLDTGNQLRDPSTGQSILVVSPYVLQSVLPKQVSEQFALEYLSTPETLSEEIRSVAPALCPRLLSYRALGVSSGMLLTLRTDWIKIWNTTYHHANVAIAPFDLGLGYSALWGGAWKGESNAHDLFKENPAVAESSAEP